MLSCQDFPKIATFAVKQSHACVADFDAERRAFNKLDLKRVRQQQAQDRVEADLMAKLESRDASLSGTEHWLLPWHELPIESSIYMLGCSSL